VDPRALAQGLGPVLRTSLGPLAGGRTLADVHPRDRLPELEFELPLAGGDSPGPVAATVREIGALLRRHLPADDPFAGYAARLEDPLVADQTLRGYLTGSIDAVLRVPAPVGGERYLVVDYKTNRLAPPDVDLLLGHYRPDALVRAMVDAHYPLQLLLYSAALHRYLRWRHPAYEPDVHLGGGLYLFVRGMAGPATPTVDGTPCGVLGWRPPTALVTELSDLLDGRAR
jgi:exodeoxyribonuclease V beta subunit